MIKLSNRLYRIEINSDLDDGMFEDYLVDRLPTDEEVTNFLRQSWQDVLNDDSTGYYRNKVINNSIRSIDIENPSVRIERLKDRIVAHLELGIYEMTCLVKREMMDVFSWEELLDTAPKIC